MKKRMTLIMSMLLAAVLAACAPGNIEASGSAPSKEAPPSSSTSASQEETSAQGTEVEKAPKLLVAYFSMPETTDPDAMTPEEENSTVVIDSKVLGNTQYIAFLIEENTGADVFRIETKTPYPTDHETLIALADKEKADGARPELLANVENLDGYDVIFLGYPNWWGDMPMLPYTFLESNDLSGKTIIPFNTHGGSGFSNTISTIAKLQPDATVETKGLSISRNDVQDSADDVVEWLETLAYIQ